MADTWYFAKDGKRVGPFSADQIRQMATAGLLKADDLLLKLGQQEWVPAHAVEGIFGNTLQDASNAQTATREVAASATLEHATDQCSGTGIPHEPKYPRQSDGVIRFNASPIA